MGKVIKQLAAVPPSKNLLVQQTENKMGPFIFDKIIVRAEGLVSKCPCMLENQSIYHG